METTLYLIRHAQSHPSKSTPQSEWPLSDRGKKQAQNLAAALESLGLDHIACSPFLRCRDTIQPFVDSSGVTVSIHEDLREKNVANGLIENFEEVWEKSWKDFDFKIEGCESSREAQSRFIAELNNVVKEHAGKTVGISAHGAVIGLLLNHIDESNLQQTADRLRNPDLLRVIHNGSGFIWDNNYKNETVDELATSQFETPIKLD